MGVLRISLEDGGCSVALRKITPRITSAIAPAIISTENKQVLPHPCDWPLFTCEYGLISLDRSNKKCIMVIYIFWRPYESNGH